ncbi:MAG: chromate efflux transporter [Verrucomicrobiales bacterium]|nr:chromate efflux transporter [Verrucomicrobiales bacterium]
MAPEPVLPAAPPTFREALRFWWKLGFISFGGPGGQIALMHEEVVRRRQWIGEERFLHALSFCHLLPGPEAQQLSIYLGWLLHGTRGGLVAGTLFVLPSAVLLWILSWVYATHGQLPWIRSAFLGLQAAVLAILLSAVLRMGKTVLTSPISGFLVLAGALLMPLRIPFPILLLGAAVVGVVASRVFPRWFPPASVRASEDLESPPRDRSAGRTLGLLLLGLVLWWGPVALLGLWLGRSHVLVEQGLFFGKAAMLTFGGAYAILPYVSQQAVGHFHWLTAPQMLDGLGLAETTPGPLIMVLQFVGFLGAWRDPGPWTPLLAGTLGAAITTWTTFVPSFLWILLGAPYVERIRRQATLATALRALSATVFGTLLYFFATLGRDVLFPQDRPVQVVGILLSVLAWLALRFGNWSLPKLVLSAAAAGILSGLLRGAG